MPTKKRTTKRKTTAKKVSRKVTASAAVCLDCKCCLNPVALGISFGIIWGAYLLLLGLLMQAGVQTVWVSPEIYDLMTSAYPGFEATTNGSFVGLVWGLVDGFVGGLLIGLVYNFVQKRCCS